ncbi:tetratricopeptide repeat protein [Aestuariibius insulae]|uniref:tetratricopeptide repeat protein n=1 Tax=Aestuariibius insulae TaxID=2058287 RepID=UPI00345F0232
MRAFVLALPLLVPSTLLAAGGGGSTPPTPTETTTQCENGQIYDEATKACADPKDARFDDDSRYDAARELAYADRHNDARHVLAAMDQSDDRTLTYLGFTARKMGDQAGAERYYQAALSANPDNLLARSYMGQGYAEAGDLDAARAQLTEIRTRGGRDTWAEVSLRLALESGTGPSY